MSSIVLSVLTNRTFILSWGSGYTFDSVLDSNIPLRPIRVDDIPYSFRSNAHIIKLLAGNNSGKLSFEELLCNPLKNIEQTVLIVDTWQWIIPILSQNPNVGHEIERLFGVDVFGNVFRHVLKPAPDIQQVLNSILNGKFKEARDYGKSIIGVHIRRHNGKGYLNDIGQQAMYVP